MTNRSVILMPSAPVPAPVSLASGRLIFGLDATGSRAPTWNIARDLQAKMFRETASLGQLNMQLVFYRGTECQKSPWVTSGERLTVLMNKITCRVGVTQIGKVLAHVLKVTATAKVRALTFIGDAMEEDPDALIGAAAELGARGVPIFMFQEGRDPEVRRVFKLIAQRSGGAYFEFNPDATNHAIDQLSKQLNAVARLAVGDVKALEAMGVRAALTDQRG
jgi:hypothetical protein